jgi:hypothetical protein
LARFTDATGRAWVIDITVDAIKRVRHICDVDLLQIVEGGLIERIVNDPIMLCDILLALCKPQADSEQISPEDFGRGLAGDAIDDAVRAMLDGMVDFFPPRRRELLRKAMAKMEAVQDLTYQQVGQRIDQIDPEALLAQLDASSTNSAASSE